MKNIAVISATMLLFLFVLQVSFVEASDNSAHIVVAQKDSGDVSLDQILSKHYEARGGEKAWQDIKTLKFTGSMRTSAGMFKTAAIYKRPDLCRLDFQSGRLYFIEAYDGTTPWQINPGITKPEIMKGKRAKEMIDTCDFEGPLVDSKKKGHKIKYKGVEKIEDRSAYVLEIALSTGNVDTYYLDTETYLPFMVKGSTTIQGNTVDTTVKVDEYIEVGSVIIPFNYEFIVDGNPDIETLQIKTIEFNKEFVHELFTLPKNPADLR